ncbi:MAG: NAD(P)/FAD-dependent oxidoreductase [Pirellulales bacterium]|nr:NAD(P)/FAD-dependent oxidoreductase [Pirellulales bacterium]
MTPQNSATVAIVGGGPAGLMAAAQAAERGYRTILFDKNRQLGVKILLSGGSRCNLTHDADARGIVEAFGPNGRFLHSALAAFGPRQVVELFEAEGVPTKIEPGGKVFPVSDRAADVRDALTRRAKRGGCLFALGEPVADVARTDAGFQIVAPQRSIAAAKLILATGGQSYPSCGTTGDGYRWAAALGHRIVAPHTALVPVTSHAPWVSALQGITLADVSVQVVDPINDTNRSKETCLASRRGALLFAHFGVSGPAVMDVSHAVSGSTHPTQLLLRCDLLPDIAEPELDSHLARACASSGKKRAAVLLDPWLPRRVGETLLELSGTPPDRPAAEFSKSDRARLLRNVKRLDIPVAGTMGFRKAEVTAGGVALDEIDSRTMRSRIVPNLYIAGELLDLNGPVGGYNFQAAFSTGWLAGMKV